MYKIKKKERKKEKKEIREEGKHGKEMEWGMTRKGRKNYIGWSTQKYIT